MTRKVVPLDPQEHRPPPVTDFWFAQLDQRLQRIEHMVDRLEWQFWIIACGAFGVLVLEIVQALSAA
ncbi:MAG: hypothetical protein AAFP98_10555 [Pseudomonadota bacterium]